VSAHATVDPPPEVRARTAEAGTRAIASLAALVAGVIHLAVAVPLITESLLVGSASMVVALGQFAFARAVRSTRAAVVLIAGAAGQLTVIALYVVSRTVDLPFLPVRDDVGHAFHHLPIAGGVGNGTPIVPDAHVQPVGVPDLVCLLAELAVLAAVVALLRDRPRRLLTDAMLALGLVALLARGVGYLP
jgi:hypothetical protein